MRPSDDLVQKAREAFAAHIGLGTMAPWDEMYEQQKDRWREFVSSVVWAYEAEIEMNSVVAQHDPRFSLTTDQFNDLERRQSAVVELERATRTYRLGRPKISSFGTAAKPILVDPEVMRLVDIGLLYHAHWIDSNTCIKNDFGPRCESGYGDERVAQAKP